jgi:hypothetical protein
MYRWYDLLVVIRLTHKAETADGEYIETTNRYSQQLLLRLGHFLNYALYYS